MALVPHFCRLSDKQFLKKALHLLRNFIDGPLSMLWWNVKKIDPFHSSTKALVINEFQIMERKHAERTVYSSFPFTEAQLDNLFKLEN